MSIQGKRIALDVSGLGIIMHSPQHTKHIANGEDYFSNNYTTPQQVQAHIQTGTIVGFGTSSPGTYLLHFHDDSPETILDQSANFKLTLGLHCVGGLVCVRDVYELLDWIDECPAEQVIKLKDGYYQVTLSSNLPDSGIVGDNQIINVHLQRCDTFPVIAYEGVPTLCY